MRMQGFLKKLIQVGLALCFVGMVISSIPAFAQMKVKPAVVLPEGYPDGFDGFGYLDRISAKDVVIDDRQYDFVLNAEYHTPRDRIATLYSFKPGDMVGFLKNERGEIISLWLIQ
ncbi:MAG: hypothetical protein FJY85_21480 [Deltaproteobacteria bacterium]|nr:hypothetical protein [Deltaproteobacteria bacterium]